MLNYIAKNETKNIIVLIYVKNKLFFCDILVKCSKIYWKNVKNMIIYNPSKERKVYYDRYYIRNNYR